MAGLIRAAGVAACLAVAFASAAMAQAPAVDPAVAPVRFVELPSDAVLVAVAFAGGYDDAPLQPAVAEARMRAAATAVPEVRHASLRIVGDAAVLFAVGPVGEAAGLARWLQVVLTPLPLDDDTLALAAARAARLADDAAFVYPGEVLASRARERLGGQAAWAVPLRGDPAVLLAAAPARLREELGRPAVASVLVLGAIPAGLREALQDVRTVPWPASSAQVAARPSAGAAEVGLEVFVERHERVDAPYVAAAFPVPDASRAALAIGLEVARGRAARRFGARQSGVLARAPHVAWSWIDAAPLVVFHRRGRDPVDRWPGEPLAHDARWAASATEAELRRFLDDLRTLPPTAAELEEARRGLCGELALTPGGQAPMPVAAALLPGRALATLFAERRGLDAGSLAAVDETAVARAMAALLAPGRGTSLLLLPLERADRHWQDR